MINEPTNTTEETGADTAAGGGVSAEVAAAETQDPTTTTATETTSATTEAGAAASTPQEDANAKLMAMLEDLGRETAEAGLDDSKLVAMMTKDELDNLPPRARAFARATGAAMAAERAKLAEQQKAWESEREATQRKLDDAAANLRRQRASLLALANTEAVRKAREGQAPQVDPTTPEGLAEIARHTALKGVADAFAPIYEEEARAKREAAYDSLQQQYPDLRDKKVEGEFLAWLQKENEGVDVSKGEAPRVNAIVGARVFFAERKAQEVARATEQRRASEAADRAVAARAMNRMSTAAQGSPVPPTPPGGWTVSAITNLPPDQREALKRSLKGRAA